ncbi:MAG: rhodanese-like domain-containing protein [Dehalococcoidia bacterium]
MRKMITRVLILAPLALLLAAAACGSESPQGELNREAVSGTKVDVDGGSYTNVVPEELQSMLDVKDFPLVNVHIPYEGEIEGTDSFIPFDRIDQYVDELPSNPDSKIVVYCRSGGMSAVAAESLVSLGYTNVWNLDGGMIGWEATGYPLVYTDSATR